LKVIEARLKITFHGDLCDLTHLSKLKKRVKLEGVKKVEVMVEWNWQWKLRIMEQIGKMKTLMKTDLESLILNLDSHQNSDLNLN